MTPKRSQYKIIRVNVIEKIIKGVSLDTISEEEYEILKRLESLGLVGIYDGNIVGTKVFTGIKRLATIYRIREVGGWHPRTLRCITPKREYQYNDCYLHLKILKSDEKLNKRKREIEKSLKAQQSRLIKSVNVVRAKDYLDEIIAPDLGSITKTVIGELKNILNCKIKVKGYSGSEEIVEDRENLSYVFPVSEREILENDELYEEVIKGKWVLLEFPSVANVVLFCKDTGLRDFKKNLRDDRKKLVVVNYRDKEGVLAAKRLKETFENIEIEYSDDIFKDIDKIADNNTLFIISHTVQACFDGVLSFDIHREYPKNYLLVSHDLLQNSGIELLQAIESACNKFGVFSDENSKLCECIARITMNEQIVREIDLWEKILKRAID